MIVLRCIVTIHCILMHPEPIQLIVLFVTCVSKKEQVGLCVQLYKMLGDN